jgi:hypothetical protein
MEARACAPEQRPLQNRHERLRPPVQLTAPVERLPIRPGARRPRALGTSGTVMPRRRTRLLDRQVDAFAIGRSGEVWPFDLDANVSLRGIAYAMKREREMKRERDELDSLAAEAGLSPFLVAMTALILVMTVVLGFAL